MGSVNQCAASAFQRRFDHGYIFSKDFVTLSFATASKKLEAIILVLMMAPKLCGDAVLGGHHLYVVPRTMTGLIRTTA
jgi:hypothetical protein